MSDQTTRLALPTPQLQDQASIEQAVRPLAQALDGLVAPLLLGPANSRPPAGVARRFFFGTDDRRLWLDTGSDWLLASAQGTVGGDLRGSLPNPELADGVVDLDAIAAALKPSAGAGAGAEALRALGTAAGRAAPGTHAAQHAQGGADALTDNSQLYTVLQAVPHVEKTWNQGLPNTQYVTAGYLGGGSASVVGTQWKTSHVPVTVPRTGVYGIDVYSAFDGGGGTFRQTLVLVNGNNQGGDTDSPAGGGADHVRSIHVQKLLQSGDVVSVQGYQDSGGTLQWNGRISVTWLGRAT